MAGRFYTSKEPDPTVFRMVGKSKCGKYQFWADEQGKTGWFNIIIRAAGKVRHKASYRIGYSNLEQRYARNHDMAAMVENHQGLLEQVHTITGWYDGI